MVLFGPRDNDNTGDYRYAPLLRPRFRAYHLLRHVWGQQHCLGSAAELVALALNSSPTETPQNTCAGIVWRQALKTPVRVLATTPGDLELVFGEVKDANAQTFKMVMNKNYRMVTGEDDNEDEDVESGVRTLRERAVAQS